MPLDPHVRRFLAMTAVGGLPPGSDRTPEGMRQAFLRLAQAVDCNEEPIGRIEERQCPGANDARTLRIYTPASGDTGPMPGLIFLHGGAGVFGSLDGYDGLCRVLANAARCRVVSVDYRLAPEHKFPAAVEDCMAATIWIAENARDLGIDPGRLAVGGDSAGGGLAAVVCRLARDTGGPRLALPFLLCPVVDPGAETPSRL